MNTLVTLSFLLGCTDKGRDRDTTTTPGPPPRWIAVSAGGYTSCALDSSGTPTCWGNEATTHPPPKAAGFQYINAGNYAYCAWNDEGSSTCWGRRVLKDVLVGLQVRDTDLGYIEECALLNDGSMISIEHGEKCDGWLQDSVTLVPEGHVGIRCVVKSGGVVECRDSVGPSHTPATGDFVEIDCAWSECCALDSAGEIVCDLGLAKDHFLYEESEYAHQLEPGPWRTLAAGKRALCAVDVNASLKCWFRHDQAEEELGDVPEGQFRSVSVGDYHACALTLDGEIHCWGRNNSGETDVPD